MVSSIKEGTVFAGRNTVQVWRSHLKGKRISYTKMPMFISGAPHKNIPKFTKSKMTDFAKIFEIRPIRGQAFFSFISFHPENVWQRNGNYLDMS
jgi:hypothetical protein